MVFWLKAFNRPGKPPVYTVSQINLVSLDKIFMLPFISLFVLEP